MNKKTKNNNNAWTKPEYKKALDLKNQGKTNAQIAKQLGRSINSIEHVLRPSYKNKNFDSVGNCAYKCTNKNTVKTTGTSDNIEAESYPSENIKTLDELIEACKIDLTKWQVERWVANTWPVAVSDHNGNINTKNLYQVKANLKRLNLNQENIKEIFDSCLKSCDRPKFFTQHKNTSSSKVLEISIPDLHLGKLAWEEETGHKNYDSQEAIDCFTRALNDLLSRNKSVSEIILPIGNDFFNVNNKENTTGHGTPQNEDGRWQKSFRKGCELSVMAINRCNQIAPVKVVIVPGNHDIERTFYLGEFLCAFFKDNKTVSIDNKACPRKYCVVGSTLLCFAHGDRIKINTLTKLAQVEERELWGKTKYCEWHLGHLHRESSIEDGGVIARVIPSLSPPDAWHSQSGYVTSNRCAQAFLYDLNNGLECIYYHRV